MQLTIQKKEFLRGLSRTHAVADRKSSMAILSNVLLSTDGPKTLRFAATDLYLAVTATAPASVKTGGSIAVSARTLFDIVKSLPDGEVSLSVTDKHRAEVRVGKVHFKVPGMPGQDFPVLPTPGNAEYANLGAEQLGRLIALTHYAMSADETRPHLAGALLEGDGKTLRMVTTDGHRLCKAECKQDAVLNFSMLVPGKGIAELRRLVEEVKSDGGKGDEGKGGIGVVSTGGNVFFRRGDVNLSVKLTEEQFPPYARVIPKTQERRVVATRSVLTEALRRISLVASDKSGAVRFHIAPGTIRITSENPDVGEGSEELDVDFAGEPVEIGFNARYLLDVLGAIVEDEVALELGGELDPGVVKPVGGTDFIGVIMPMRI